jgi:DNA-binding NarL/FixJ family response regulator
MQQSHPLRPAVGKRDAAARALRRRAGSSCKPAVRVVVVSPIRLVREGLATILGKHDEVALLAAVDLDEAAVAGIAALQPDVMLVDLSGRDPLAGTGTLRRAVPLAKLVAFAVDEVNEHVFACAAAGFSGYVPRHGGEEELVRAVLDVARGQMHCAPHITAAMFGRLSQFLREAAPSALQVSFTARENEVWALVQRGSSNKEIARRLGISSATVKNHVHSILAKLQVTRRAEAIARLRGGRAD